MVDVYLNIGSNINRKHNIRSCMKQLQTDYPDVVFSNVYETEAYGFEGNAFFNLAAALTTQLPVDEFEKYLKNIEHQHARKRNGVKFSSRTLDIDLLLYGDLVLQPDKDLPRKEILKYSFVLFPLEEIAGDVIHPELDVSITAISESSDLKRSDLSLVRLPT